MIEQFILVLNSSKAEKEVSAFFEIGGELTFLVKVVEVLAGNQNAGSCCC
ncbi:hypothetical protein [Bacillus mesophilum]